jgi:hypothetical protein
MALRNNLHVLTGVYALDALDTAAEVARFERHLNRCHSCTTEVRGFQETTTSMARAVSHQPPPALRAAVMADVARTRQVPATEDHARHARRPTRRARLLPRLAMAGVALSLAAAITLGVVLVNTQNQLGQTQQQLGQARRQLTQAQTQLAAITAVRTAADAQLLSKATKIGGTVHAVRSGSRHQIVVTTSGLPPLKAGKVYQLWLIGRAPNKIRSEGLLAAPRNGHTAPVLISGVLAGDTLGVSVQQAGGSIQPTLPAVIVLMPAS